MRLENFEEGLAGINKVRQSFCGKLQGSARIGKIGQDWARMGEIRGD